MNENNILPRTALELARKQALDERLWLDLQRASQEYLQQALRELHAAVELDATTTDELVFDSILAKHSGENNRREWTQHGWLHPGDMVVVLRP